MPTFAFTARAENGAAISGTLQGASVAEVGRMLRGEGKYPVSIRPASDEPAAVENPEVSAISPAGIKLSRAEVIQLSMQLAVMIETGVTLSEALDCVAAQANKPVVRQLAQDLGTHVQGGTDFSTALTRHPRSFPRLYIALIRASEKSGMLGRLLHRATQYLRDEQETLRRVKGALTYPAIMFSFAVATTIGLLAFVLPRFTVIYENKGAVLPAPTRVLMALSGFVTGHWVGLLTGIATAALFGYLYFQTTSGLRLWHTVQLRLPLTGLMFRKLYLARSMRMIGTMAGAGINLVESVNTAQDLCGNVHYREMWASVCERIQAGKPMSDALSNTTLVPRSVAQMIHSGEKGGKLAQVMEQVANYNEQELKETIAQLTRYIEPAMIVLMGLLIGGVALALMLPIFTISRVVAH